MNELELDQYAEEFNDTKESSEEIKGKLDPLVDELYRLYEEKEILEASLKDKNKLIISKEFEIRDVWGPYIVGVEKAEMDLGDLKLSTKKVLNVKASDKQEAVKWFMDNGYKDVLKYDIHHQTMGKIAREHYASDEMIPGLEYSNFDKLTVKPNLKKVRK